MIDMQVLPKVGSSAPSWEQHVAIRRQTPLSCSVKETGILESNMTPIDHFSFKQIVFSKQKHTQFQGVGYRVESQKEEPERTRY